MTWLLEAEYLGSGSSWMWSMRTICRMQKRQRCWSDFTLLKRETGYSSCTGVGGSPGTGRNILLSDTGRRRQPPFHQSPFPVWLWACCGPIGGLITARGLCCASFTLFVSSLQLLYLYLNGKNAPSILHKYIIVFVLKLAGFPCKGC